MKISVGQIWNDVHGKKFVITSVEGGRFRGIREDGKVFDTVDFFKSDESLAFEVATKAVYCGTKPISEAVAMLFSKEAEA